MLLSGGMKRLPALALLMVWLLCGAACSDAVLVPDGGNGFGELDGTIRGSPYEAGTPLPDGAADAALDPDAEAETDGDWDGATGPDATAGGDGGDGGDLDGGADGSAVDTGPKVCPADLFGASRAAPDLKFGDTYAGAIQYDCDAARHPIILAKGQHVRVKLHGPNLLPGLHLYGPGIRGLQLEDVTKARGATASVEFTADLPGEYFAVVDQSGRHGTSAYEVSLECLEQCALRATRYPIVMVHGFSGFHNIGPIDYFYNVVNTIAPQGYDLHIAVLDAYNSTEKRGPELAVVIDQVLAETFAYKVNIIAHSQGGVDSRFVISELGYGDRIGLLNMIATPHHGTQLADVIINDPTGIGKPILDAMLAVMGAVLDGPEAEQNAHDSFVTLSTAYMEEFNKTHLDDPRVAYKSWAGRTCEVWESNCPNPVNAYLVVTYELLKSQAGENDAIVPTDSAKWTGFQGVLDADHFDEVGQLAGMTGGFDHLKFYQSVVDGTAADGY